MKLYLAGRYSRRTSLRAAARSLLANGYTVQARWLYSRHSPDELQIAAEEDYEDVVACDVLLLWTDPQGSQQRGGGRHFELGLAYSLRKPVVAIGTREIIFHWLPHITWATSLADAMRQLEPARLAEPDDFKWYTELQRLRAGGIQPAVN